MNKIAILGAGLVGGPIARDLSKDTGTEVIVYDNKVERLDELQKNYGLKGQHVDLTMLSGFEDILADVDIAVNAVPGFMGFQTLKKVIQTGTDCVDIAFFPEDLFLLHDLAVKQQVTVLSDFGVAPGLSHLLSGYAATFYDRIKHLRIYVGGLPKKRELPWEYKAVFSPADVIEEYIRPARLVENGRHLTKNALTDVEHINLLPTGSLEAFNSDGLRSLLSTMQAENMVEKTLRFPGYSEKIQLLINTGFLDTSPVIVNGKEVSPIELTKQLLFKQWQLDEGAHDFTIMHIVIEGEEKGEIRKRTFDLYDEYDEIGKVHSMARTTGYTASMGVRLLLQKIYSKPGINPPEFVGKDRKAVDFILCGLEERGIQIKMG